MKKLFFLSCLIAVALSSCGNRNKSREEQVVLSPIMQKALNDETSKFYGDYKSFPTSLNKLPIGVFDSGTGGLTVLEVLLKADMVNNTSGKPGSDGIPDFAGEAFTYLADRANMPYGNYAAENKQDFFKELVVKDALFLLDNKYWTNPADKVREGAKQPCKILVIACNTATANSTHLKNEIDIPVIGVIEPTSKYAYDESVSKNILVLATNVTIESNSYQEALKKLDSNGNYYFCKCSEFVDAIEANNVDTNESHQLVNDKLKEFKDKNIDTVILGCTHFGLFSKEILSTLPNVKLVPCGLPTSKRLKEVLEEQGIMNLQRNIGSVKINATSDPEFMEKKISWFKGNYDHVKFIKL